MLVTKVAVYSPQNAFTIAAPAACSLFSSVLSPRSSVLLCLLLFLAQPAHASHPERIFIYGKPQEAVTLDPSDLRDLESAAVTSTIFDTLVQFAPRSMTIHPGLADRWQSSADGKVWSFHLRPDVHFHDGTPCDAAAVKFNYDRQSNPKNPFRFGGKFAYWRQLFGAVKAVAAPRADTVVFTLNQPDAVFLANLTAYSNGIMSPASIRRYGADVARHPVGTGPFRFISWTRGQRIVLRADPSHWAVAPRVDRLIFKAIPDNTVRLMELFNGDIHGMDGINPDDVARIRQNSSVRLLAQAGMNLGYLAFNTSHKPLQDLRVRQAISWAIKKRPLLQAFFSGGTTGQSPKNLLPPTMWGYDNSAREPEYAPRRARELLTAAGFPQGLSLTLWAPPIARPYLPDGQKVAQAIQADLAGVGIQARILTYEWSTFLAKTARGEHDLLLSGWTGDNGDPDDFLYTLLHSRNAIPGSATNKAFYRNPKVDALLERGRQSTSPPRRLGIYREIQAIAGRDLPYVPLFTAMQLAAIRHNVRGFELQPSGRKDFSKVEVIPSP